MKKYLLILGAISLVGPVVFCLITGNFWGILPSIIGGIFSSAIFFGIATVLHNQENFSYELQEARRNRASLQQKLICKKCNKEYDKDFSSCPFCGYRE